MIELWKYKIVFVDVLIPGRKMDVGPVPGQVADLAKDGIFFAQRNSNDPECSIEVLMVESMIEYVSLSLSSVSSLMAFHSFGNVRRNLIKISRERITTNFLEHAHSELTEPQRLGSDHAPPISLNFC